MDEILEVNWQSYLDVLFPSLSKVYLPQKEMAEVNRQLTERLCKLGKKIAITERGIVEESTTFYDLLLRVVSPTDFTQREYKVAIGLLTTLNTSVEEYFELIDNDPILISQLKKLLDGLFRVNGDKYLDKIGELQSILYLMKSNKQYKLVALEYKFERNGNEIIQNSTDADLFFVNEANGEKILIDVVNLNLDAQKIESEELLEKLIRHRLSNKKEKKKFDTNYVKDNYSVVKLQPFLWIFDIDVIERHKKFFSKLIDEDNLPILCLRQRVDISNNIFYDCTKITDIKA